MNAHELAELIQKSKKSGAGYVGLCPAHDDNKTSLSWRDSGGKIVVTCHTGCAFTEIAIALNLKIADFFHP